MEKTDRETHDFMNVESFSQLPFIRPSPLKEKAIRLFGKDFAADSTTDDDFDTTNMHNTRPSSDPNDTEDQFKETATENNRKFECHYCCRNFPTSQALGGHQNAHKRERQHAKRVHQSTIINGGYADPNIYNSLINYHHRFTTANTPPSFYHHITTTNPNNSTHFNNPRFYPTNSINYPYSNNPSNNHSHNHSHNQIPINGSPLAMYRTYPTAQITSTINRHHLINPATPNAVGLQASRIPTNSSYMFESKPSVQDHVSLDLRL